MPPETSGPSPSLTTRLGLLIIAVCSSVAASFALWFFNYHGKKNEIRGPSDYLGDADEPMLHVLDGDLFGLYATDPPPLMMPLPLLLRLPALFVARLFDSQIGEMARYEVTSIVLVAIAGFIVLAALGSFRRAGVITAALFAAALLASPLSTQALLWGHPEEIFGSATLLAALVLGGRSRWSWSALALGAAIATKQPFWLAAPAVMLFVPAAHRLRYAAIAVAVPLLVSLPTIVPSLGAVIDHNLGTTTGSGAQSGFELDLFHALGLESTYGHLSKPLILAVALLVPLALASQNQWKLTGRTTAALLAAILLVRCLLDPYNISYYALPAMTAALALDWMAWHERRHPLQRINPLASVPIPLYGTITGVILAGASGGWITSYVTAALGGSYAAVYSLCGAVLILGFVLDLARVEWDRQRQLLYGGGAFAAAVILVAAALTVSESTKREPIAPPGGYKAMSADQAGRALAPAKGYWLGRRDLQPGVFLRLMALRVQYDKGGGWKVNRKTAAALLLDYGYNEKVDSVTLFTFKSLPKALPRIIDRCRRGRCKQDQRVISTPIGPALLNERPVGGEWEAQVIAGGQRVYILSTLRIPPHEVLSRLQALPQG